MHNAQPDFIAYIIAVVVLLLSFRLRRAARVEAPSAGD
jgi:hypothetical protein